MTLIRATSSITPNNGRKNISSNIYERSSCNVIFNQDVIFFVDSNVKGMNPDIMSDQATCAKFYCPKIEQIINVIIKSAQILQ